MSKLGYTFFPKDFISDPVVMMMTPAERGIYRDLIDLAYMNDNVINFTIEQLSKYTNASNKEVENVLKLKGEKIDNYWTIPSCVRRIDIINQNRVNGKKGGRPKTQSKTETITEPITETIRQKKRKEKEIKKKVKESKVKEDFTVDNIDFSEPLKIYPYCQKIQTAKDLWNNLLPLIQSQVMAHIKIYVANHSNNKKQNFLPDFASYLDEKRYEATHLPYEDKTESKVYVPQQRKKDTTEDEKDRQEWRKRYKAMKDEGIKNKDAEPIGMGSMLKKQLDEMKPKK